MTPSDEKREVRWFPGWPSVVMTLAVIIVLAFVTSEVVYNVSKALEPMGQPYCDTLSGDGGETMFAAQEHFCEYNCRYNVSTDSEGRYPPCKDHGYTFNRTAFLTAAEHTI